MRLFVMAGLMGAALATPAAACPQGTRCIAMLSAPAEFTSVRALPAETRAIAPAPIAFDVRRAVRAVSIDRHASLRSSLSSFEPIQHLAGEVEMPWIWAVLATEVESRLPRYDRSDEFSMVLSPVVVRMPTESTPGLGLSGDF